MGLNRGYLATLCGLTAMLASVGAIPSDPPSSTAYAARTVRCPPVKWGLPKLHRPLKVTVTPRNRWLTLSPDRDYIVRMPQALRGSGGLTIEGGHNVVLVGGEIVIPKIPTPLNGDRTNRAVELKDQTGTIYLEGIRITGAGASEGIDLDEPDPQSIVQLENIRIDGIRAYDEQSWTDNHPDLIQTWAGPGRLEVDRLTGFTDYQALYLSPEEHGPNIRSASFYNVDMGGLPVKTSPVGAMLWKMSKFPTTLKNVWLKRHPSTTVEVGAWPGLRLGAPRIRSYVRKGDAGVGYVSPRAKGCRRPAWR